MFDTLRRQLDDVYRTQDSGMSVGLPKVTVDASQLKHLLDHYDALVGVRVERDMLYEALEEMVAEFGGGAESKVSDRVLAIDKACKALSKQERLGKEFEDAIMNNIEDLYEP